MGKSKSSMLKSPAFWIIFAIIVGGIVVWGAYTKWWGLSGQPATPTTMTLSGKNKLTNDPLNVTFQIYSKDTTGVDSSTEDGWTYKSLAAGDNYVINTNKNDSAVFTYTANTAYWAYVTVQSPGTWYGQWVVLSPGENIVYFVNQTATLRALAYSELLGSTLANTTVAKWTVMLGCYDSQNNVTATAGFGTYWNATDPTVTKKVEGIVNYGITFVFNFASVPQLADVDVFGSVNSQVQGNSIIVFLGHTVSSRSNYNVVFGSRVVTGTIAVSSLSIGLGSVAGLMESPLATLA